MSRDRRESPVLQTIQARATGRSPLRIEELLCQIIPILPQRRSIRLRGYDYSQAGAYFVTICAHDKKCLFGEVRDGEMGLNEWGTILAGSGKIQRKFVLKSNWGPTWSCPIIFMESYLLWEATGGEPRTPHLVSIHSVGATGGSPALIRSSPLKPNSTEGPKGILCPRAPKTQTT